MHCEGHWRRIRLTLAPITGHRKEQRLSVAQPVPSSWRLSPFEIAFAPCGLPPSAAVTIAGIGYWLKRAASCIGTALSNAPSMHVRSLCSAPSLDRPEGWRRVDFAPPIAVRALPLGKPAPLPRRMQRRVGGRCGRGRGRDWRGAGRDGAANGSRPAPAKPTLGVPGRNVATGRRAVLYAPGMIFGRRVI